MVFAPWIYKDSKRINVKAGIKSSSLQVRGPSGCYHYYFIIIVIAFQDFTGLVKKTSVSLTVKPLLVQWFKHSEGNV